MLGRGAVALNLLEIEERVNQGQCVVAGSVDVEHVDADLPAGSCKLGKILASCTEQAAQDGRDFLKGEAPTRPPAVLELLEQELAVGDLPALEPAALEDEVVADLLSAVVIVFVVLLEPVGLEQPWHAPALVVLVLSDHPVVDLLLG